MVNRRRRQLRGFTLFELVLVALIIGIMGLIVIPLVGASAGGPKIETAANQLAADIEYCQSLCIARSDSQFFLRFSNDDNRYWIESRASGANSSSVIQFPGDNQSYINDFTTGRNHYLAGVSLGTLTPELTSYRLTFNRYGQPIYLNSSYTQTAVTQNIVIPLTGGGRTMYVMLTWDTGEVSISK